MEDPKKGWLLHYLQGFDAYIQPGVVFEDLDALDFYLPNLYKSSKEKTTFIFPSGSKVKDLDEAAKIIMVSWKMEGDT